MLRYSSFGNFQRSFLVDMSILSHLLKRGLNFFHVLKGTPPLKFSSAYLDSYGCNIAIENSYQEEFFIEYFTKYYAPFLNFRIVPYLEKTYELTARSYQHRASANKGVGLVTGILSGYKGLEFCVTAGHVVSNVGDIVHIGGGIQAECIAKEDLIEIHSGIKCTADMAFLKVIGQGNNNNFNKIEICGQIYSKKLWRGGTEVLMPGKEVWMYNQDEEIKKGIIFRYMVCDAQAKLYNVVQVIPKAEEEEEVDDDEQQQQQFSSKGDSGACVLLPPEVGSNAVYVFGMVASRCLNTGLTNAVILKNVIPHMVKNTNDSFYPKGPDICDDDDNDDEESIFKVIEFLDPVAEHGNLDAGPGPTTSEGHACANIGALQDPESGFGSASG